MTTERSLADTTPEPPETRATDRPLGSSENPGNPAEFSFAEFIRGVRPTRRAVTLYAAGDLMAEADILRARIAEAEGVKSTTEARRLRAELKAVSERMTSASIDVIVEARSTDWYARLGAALDKDLAATPATAPDADVPLVVRKNLHIVQQQIVEPAGVTYTDLVALWRVSNKQVDRLVAAALSASNDDQGVVPDFSRAASVARRIAG